MYLESSTKQKEQSKNEETDNRNHLRSQLGHTAKNKDKDRTQTFMDKNLLHHC